MKQSSTLLLRALIVSIAVVVLYALIIFPQTEGRAVDLDLMSIYSDPLIIYGYLASIPFFVGLYQAFVLVGLLGKDKLVSVSAIHATRTIKYSAAILPVLIVGAVVFIVFNADGDDYTGPVGLGVLMSIGCISIVVASAKIEKHIQKKISRKKK